MNNLRMETIHAFIYLFLLLQIEICRNREKYMHEGLKTYNK